MVVSVINLVSRTEILYPSNNVTLEPASDFNFHMLLVLPRFWRSEALMILQLVMSTSDIHRIGISFLCWIILILGDAHVHITDRWIQWSILVLASVQLHLSFVYNFKHVVIENPCLNKLSLACEGSTTLPSLKHHGTILFQLLDIAKEPVLTLLKGGLGGIWIGRTSGWRLQNQIFRGRVGGTRTGGTTAGKLRGSQSSEIIDPNQKLGTILFSNLTTLSRVVQWPIAGKCLLH